MKKNLGVFIAILSLVFMYACSADIGEKEDTDDPVKLPRMVKGTGEKDPEHMQH